LGISRFQLTSFNLTSHKATASICELYSLNLILFTRRTIVANHKSAIKRNKQNAVRAARNTHIRSTMRTLVKNVRDAVAAGDKEAATQAMAKAIPYIDKTSTKGVIHKATASRKISRLNKLVNTLG
jgi:small subunit ribosomal protein S20